ncbi:hypothetical protein [Chromobacterium violaceum]|uniref:hypothetical protein n=1 Tax=Chromobacterium violaceum TaxID=536 RepID=UPI001CE0A93C|nr:hypothetical protein [Chromobacterium violaceum]
MQPNINPAALAEEIKAAIRELAGDSSYPDLLEAVDKLAADAEGSRQACEQAQWMLHDNITAMQAAWIEWKHGAGADSAMEWIENTLAGPGLIPDEDEPNSQNAQAWHDVNCSLALKNKGK